MNTAEGPPPEPKFDETILDTDQDAKADAQAALIARFQAQVLLKSHEPGLLGKLFGGQATAATNITGLVALCSLAGIVLFGLLAPTETTTIEILKSIMFLSIGAFGSKKLGSE